MQTTEKITGVELGLLQFTFVVSTIILTIPGVIADFADQAAWLSVFPAILSGLISVLVMIALANRYPGLTIIQYSSKIIGSIPGKLLGLYYVYFWFMSISIMTTQHNMFINTFLLPKTPWIVGSLTILAICALIVFKGIEVIGRCNGFLTPLILLFLIPLLLLTARDADPGHLKPIIGHGLLPILQGAVAPTGAFMNQLFILGWLLPYLNQPKKALKVSLFALAGISALILTTILVTIMLLGPLSGKLTYSFLTVIQYIGFEGSIERLEALAVSMWVTGTFIKLSVSLFILSISVSQLFGIGNYRDILIPLTLLCTVGSIWVFGNSAELMNYLTYIYPFGGFLTQSFIPLALLLIDIVKRKTRGSPP